MILWSTNDVPLGTIPYLYWWFLWDVMFELSKDTSNWSSQMVLLANHCHWYINRDHIYIFSTLNPFENYQSVGQIPYRECYHIAQFLSVFVLQILYVIFSFNNFLLPPIVHLVFNLLNFMLLVQHKLFRFSLRMPYNFPLFHLNFGMSSPCWLLQTI